MTSIPSTSPQQLLSDFDAELVRVLEQVEGAANFSDYESALGSGATILAEEINKIGDSTATYLNGLSPKASELERLPASIVSYLWIEDAKSFMLLWRNILLQQQKAKIMELDGKIRKSALLQLRTESKEILRAAATELQSAFNKDLSNLKNLSKASKKQLKQWKFQQNPWPVYQQQINQLAAQCRDAEVQQNGLQNTTTGFQDIHQLIQETITSCRQELEQLKVFSQQTTSFIEEHIENKPGKVATHLEELGEDIKIPDHLTVFKQSLNEKVLNLAAKMQVPIDTNGGMVQFKETNFKKNARQWLDSEVIPVLYEIWELTEGAEHSMKMSLVNVKNRATLLSNEVIEGRTVELDKDIYYQPLESLQKKVDNWLKDINDLEQVIDQRMQDNFYVSKIYDVEKAFLPVSLQSTLGQFAIGQNKLLKQAQSQLTKRTGFIRRFRDTVSEEESLSASEKIGRTIEDRSVQSENNQYTSIFQTKGYIGESFWIGRDNELQRIQNLIDQWEKGYRGAVVICGERLSGKSLFGEVIANKYFPKRVIRLLPNTNMKTGGRKWTTTYDLKQALDFLKKNEIHSRSLVWIDDLELWQNNSISLSQNVRHLLSHIDNHATQLFYMVSMSKWLAGHLQKTNDIQHSFQGTISLDKMSIPEIQQAILIRHGATHKVLVNEEGEEVASEAFDRMTASICRSAQGNIGEALDRWAASIHKVSEENVVHRKLADYILPDFLTPDTSLLLASIIKEKRTNEYRLRQLFGIAFKEKYSNILQRLLSTGILTRQIDGMLEINDVIVNDLARMLARKKYL